METNLTFKVFKVFDFMYKTLAIIIKIKTYIDDVTKGQNKKTVFLISCLVLNLMSKRREHQIGLKSQSDLMLIHRF